MLRQARHMLSKLFFTVRASLERTYNYTCASSQIDYFHYIAHLHLSHEYLWFSRRAFRRELDIAIQNIKRPMIYNMTEKSEIGWIPALK